AYKTRESLLRRRESAPQRSLADSIPAAILRWSPVAQIIYFRQHTSKPSSALVASPAKFQFQTHPRPHCSTQSLNPWLPSFVPPRSNFPVSRTSQTHPSIWSFHPATSQSQHPPMLSSCPFPAPNPGRSLTHYCS